MKTIQNPTAPQTQEYVVWYDSALSEILTVEKTHYTDALDTQLKKEQIQPVSIYCASRQEAQEIYIENYETLLPETNSVVEHNAGTKLVH